MYYDELFDLSNVIFVFVQLTRLLFHLKLYCDTGSSKTAAKKNSILNINLY